MINFIKCYRVIIDEKYEGFIRFSLEDISNDISDILTLNNTLTNKFPINIRIEQYFTSDTDLKKIENLKEKSKVY